MPRSMTGFGTGSAENGGASMVVQIRSVNHRYCDVAVRIPKELGALEDKVRACVQDRVSRGRIEIGVTIQENLSGSCRLDVDIPLAKAYRDAITRLREALQLPECHLSAETFIGLPDVIRADERGGDPDAAWPLLEEALSRAVEAMVSMREQEGRKLCDDIIHRTDKIEQFIKRIGERAPNVASEWRSRLEARMRELLHRTDLDESRLALEAAVFAEKSSIDEELVRITSHIGQIRETIRSHGPIGKKLDFLIQESQREANTIASKANDLDIVASVIEIKVELERIREQIQNIE